MNKALRSKIGEEGIRNRLFHAKILLFGEYSIIFDSMALSVPFSRFSARFELPGINNTDDPEFASLSNALLKDYAAWLGGSENGAMFKGLLDLDAFKSDIGRGLFFNSDIPQGWGLGSSGALCAAVYDRYALGGDPDAGHPVVDGPGTRQYDGDYPGTGHLNDAAHSPGYGHNAGDSAGNGPGSSHSGLFRLKRIFADMEKYFHGTSSGIDPLNCYLDRPLLINPAEGISIVSSPVCSRDKGIAVFLIDTGLSRDTGPLVKLFIERSREQKFMELIVRIMMPAVDSSIRSLLSSRMDTFMNELGKLSRFQLDNMGPMIPDRFKGLWGKGMESGDFYLKLCGSGGGGYLLGFTRDMEKTGRIMAGNELDTIPVCNYMIQKEAG